MKIIIKNKMVKKLLVFFFCCVEIVATAAETVLANDTDIFIEKFYETTDVSVFEENMTVQTFFEFFGCKNIGEFLGLLTEGKVSLDYSTVKNWLSANVRIKAEEKLAIVLSITALCILSYLCDELLKEKLSDSGKNAAFYSVYFVCCVIVIGIFQDVKNGTLDLCGAVSDFTLTALPVMFSLLISSSLGIGKVSSLMVIMGFCEGVAFIITEFLMPAAVLCFILSVMQNAFSGVNCAPFIDAVTKIANFLLTLCSVGFVLVISLSGITLSASAGIKMQSIKLAAKFIPVAGDFLTASIDIARAFMVILTDIVGLVGTVAVLMIAVTPIAEIIISYLCLAVSSIVAQLFADKRLSGMLSNASSCLYRILSYCFILAVLCIVAIGAAVFFGNMMFSFS